MEGIALESRGEDRQLATLLEDLMSLELGALETRRQLLCFVINHIKLNKICNFDFQIGSCVSIRTIFNSVSIERHS